MTSVRAHTVCVDIGNSGMRCVLVPPTPNVQAHVATNAPTTTPWIGQLLRVDWPAAQDDSPADAPLSTHRGEPVGKSIAHMMEQSLGQWLQELPAPGRWLVSSVQRTMEGHLKSVVDKCYSASDYRLVTHGDLGLEVQVDFPDKVGIDRLLAALAAASQVPDQPLIVIQAGSAITVDWFEPPQTFGGGAIMPGVPMMLRLLSTAADLLPAVAAKELLNLPPLPGKNTAAAMNAGASSAVVGGVQHLVTRYRDQFGARTMVVMSGGDGPLLSPHVTGPLTIIDHLVLRGLAEIAGRPG